MNEELMEYVTAFLMNAGLPAERAEIQTLAGDGSTRIFWRIIPDNPSGPSFVVMENTPDDDFAGRENLAYLRIGKHLKEKGLPAAEIHSCDLERGWFVLEDFGDISLQDAVSQHDHPVDLYKRVVEILFQLQIEGAEGFKGTWTCQTETYDQSVMRQYESDYFREAYLVNYLKLNRDWSTLNRTFDYLAEKAGRAEGGFFLHRDFQSRNIMIADEKIGIIDWQGGRLGPLAYDLASLIIDPYVALRSIQRDRIYQHYLQLLGDYRAGWVDAFEATFPFLAIQRNLQILGAFSFLTRVRGKTSFEVYIDPALESLHQLLRKLEDPKLSPLTELVNDILSL